MAQAKTLTNDQLLQVLDYVAKNSSMPIRDYAIILLSFKAGLRAQEIAGLQWRNVTTASGEIAETFIEIPASIAKKGHKRAIPMHSAVYVALQALHKVTQARKQNNTVITARDGVSEVSPNTLQRYISRLYTAAGLYGVTSHSGRRTFITRAARIANTHGCSLKDVQLIAGHKYIDTTEHYVDASDRVSDLVNAI